MQAKLIHSLSSKNLQKACELVAIFIVHLFKNEENNYIVCSDMCGNNKLSINFVWSYMAL